MIKKQREASVAWSSTRIVRTEQTLDPVSSREGMLWSSLGLLKSLRLTRQEKNMEEVGRSGRPVSGTCAKDI